MFTKSIPIRSTIALSLIILVLTSCRNDVYVPGACYNQTIKPIIISNCTMSGCHGSSGGRRERMDFTTYEGLMRIVTPKHPLRSELYSVITANGGDRMPPDHRLTNKEIMLIKSWIAFGAAQNDCPSTGCDTNNVTYSNQVTNIISKNCVNCHNTGNVILNNYTAVHDYAISGKLVGCIKQLGGFKAMPEGYKLSDCDIRTIEKWVQAGSPNN